jgi:hypothetical protein
VPSGRWRDLRKHVYMTFDSSMLSKAITRCTYKLIA